jgi:hypothetical protein
MDQNMELTNSVYSSNLYYVAHACNGGVSVMEGAGRRATKISTYYIHYFPLENM